MTVKEFLESKPIYDLDEYLYSHATSGELVEIIQTWLREFALINCAEQKKLCDLETDNLKETDYAVLDAPYPNI